MKKLELWKILQIGIKLSSNENDSSLVTAILDATMELTNSDMGVLYAIKGENCEYTQTMTGVALHGAKDRQFFSGSAVLPKICLEAARSGRQINIPKCTDKIAAEIMFSHQQIAENTIHSMLITPMKDEKGEIQGIIQLMNAREDDGTLIPFSNESSKYIYSLGCLGAAHLENQNYNREITRLLESIVQVLSTAIDARSPYNANHTINMARYAGNFLQWLRENKAPVSFTPNEEKEFLMAVWLHDIGKLVTPVEVMDKATRLATAEKNIRERFERIELLTENRYLKGEITGEEYVQVKKDLNEAMEMVNRINEAGYVLPEDLSDQILQYAERTYIEKDGRRNRWFTDEEIEALTIRKGTLTSGERSIMQGHVVMTEKLLSQMHFSRAYRHVTGWAVNHHEYLDGTGYPKKLTAKDLTFPMRLLTVLDIFDALTAKDRPYKQPLSTEKALVILEEMADAGKIDGEVLSLFARSKAWL